MADSTSKVKPAREGPSLLAAAQIRDNQPMRTPTVHFSSGLSVRLPVMVTWVSAMAALLGLAGAVGCLVAVVVRTGCACLLPGRGQQVPAGVGVPVWSATVLASCL